MSPLKILVVEDDPDVRELVTLTLARSGHAVSTAADGAMALAQVEHERPDLILLDLRMPGMDGRAFARAYAARPGPRARIVVVSAGRDPAGAAAELQADGFLSKPFSLDELLEVVALHGRG